MGGRVEGRKRGTTPSPLLHRQRQLPSTPVTTVSAPGTGAQNAGGKTGQVLKPGLQRTQPRRQRRWRRQRADTPLPPPRPPAPPGSRAPGPGTLSLFASGRAEWRPAWDAGDRLRGSLGPQVTRAGTSAAHGAGMWWRAYSRMPFRDMEGSVGTVSFQEPVVS